MFQDPLYRPDVPWRLLNNKLLICLINYCQSSLWVKPNVYLVIQLANKQVYVLTDLTGAKSVWPCLSSNSTRSLKFLLPDYAILIYFRFYLFYFIFILCIFNQLLSQMLWKPKCCSPCTKYGFIIRLYYGHFPEIFNVHVFQYVRAVTLSVLIWR